MEYFDVYKNYVPELDKICLSWSKKYSNETISFLKEWFLKMIICYDEKQDILNHHSLEEYVKEALEKER